MSLPTVPVITTNLDAGTDDPAQARADLLDLAQKFNSVLDYLINLPAVFSSGSGMVTKNVATNYTNGPTVKLVVINFGRTGQLYATVDGTERNRAQADNFTSAFNSDILIFTVQPNQVYRVDWATSGEGIRYWYESY